MSEPDFKIYNHLTGELARATGVHQKGETRNVYVDSRGESETVIVIQDVPINYIIFFHWSSDAEIYPSQK